MAPPRPLLLAGATALLAGAALLPVIGRSGPGGPREARTSRPAGGIPASHREVDDLVDALSRGRPAAALAGVVAFLDRWAPAGLDPPRRAAFVRARREAGLWGLGEAERLAAAGEPEDAEALLRRAERALRGTDAEGEVDGARARLAALAERRAAAAREREEAEEAAAVETALSAARRKASDDPEGALADLVRLAAASRDPASRRALQAESGALRGVIRARKRRADLRARASDHASRGRYGKAREILEALVAGDDAADPEEAAKDRERLEALDDLERNGEPPVLVAVRVGLRWVARQQLPDGSFGWTSIEAKERGLPEEKRPNHPQRTGLTALAAHALLGHVRFDWTDEFEPNLDRALAWILSVQKPDGSFSRNLYEHSICTLVLVDADRLLHKTAVRPALAAALAWLQDARNADGAWRYAPRTGPSDMSVTGWALQALLHARMGRYEVRAEVIDGAFAWIDRMTDASGKVGYKDPGVGSPAMTAAALFCRLRHSQGIDDDRVRSAADLLLRDLPRAGWRQTSYHLFYASDALSRLGGDHWRRWAPGLKKLLLDSQVKKGDAAGAWPTKGDTWAERVGSVYLASMHCLALENFFEHRD